MTLGELKNYIESLPEKSVLKYSLSYPFSWRGSYNEVAFSIIDKKITKEELLIRVNVAFKDVFYGYKGGEYRYNEYTDINFEEDYSKWSDGRYRERYISKILGLEERNSEEKRLIKLMFNN